MSRRKKKRSIPDPDAPELIRGDKLRGILLGMRAGEALGSPIDGLDRDAILRTHGRVVRPPDGCVEGPLSELARRLASRLTQGRLAEPDAAVEAGWQAMSPSAAERLVAAPIVVRQGGDDVVGLARAQAASLGGDGAVVAGSAILASLTSVALATGPYETLATKPVIAAVGAAVGESLASELTTLAELVRSAPAPGDCTAPFAHLPIALSTSFLVCAALLARPRALRESVVFAVNLGGLCSLRGALTGAIAAAHRGAAGIPERWSSVDAGDAGRRL